MKLLLIEDDLDLARGLQRALEREGYVVECSGTGKQALELLPMVEPDLVILDLGLPDMEGMTVLQRLRGKANRVPVLVLTARSGTEALVGALDQGADDYLKKPFDMAELLARVRTLSRRQSGALASTVRIDGVTLDLAAHQVAVEGEVLSLARREFMLLKALIENPGRIMTKQALANKIYNWDEDVASNAIEVHVSNLRKKLPEGFIKTIRGVGYVVQKSRGA